MSQLNAQQSGQFISLVTMQNHLPFTDKYYHYNYRANGKAAKYNKTEINHYIEGIHLTDEFTKTFLDKLDKINRPITVLWYGDHLAGLYSGDDINKYYIPLHETDYFIYSNKYAREHGYSYGKQTKHTQVISPNVFTALALRQMNQKVSPYYALITNVADKLPATAMDNEESADGLMVNKNSQRVSSSKLTASQKRLLNDYKLIQYDLVAGKQYVKDLHFMK
ncbi:sulfatase-like hydrolase/transferase [Lactobacillus rossiae]|uniref:Sulfatase-like hydrolase/transferase n=2 Tax=Furfurilactobacillus TaxID=2767882 RepID=A0A7C9IQX1_9LACO|nr:sulfatase-like hydrolase/transferase [Furfurilactobacillus milii]